MTEPSLVWLCSGYQKVPELNFLSEIARYLCEPNIVPKATVFSSVSELERLQGRHFVLLEKMVDTSDICRC